jgi:hypothetical protein
MRRRLPTGRRGGTRVKTAASRREGSTRSLVLMGRSLTRGRRMKSSAVDRPPPVVGKFGWARVTTSQSADLGLGVCRATCSFEEPYAASCEPPRPAPSGAPSRPASPSTNTCPKHTRSPPEAPAAGSSTIRTPSAASAISAAMGDCAPRRHRRSRARRAGRASRARRRPRPGAPRPAACRSRRRRLHTSRVPAPRPGEPDATFASFPARATPSPGCRRRVGPWVGEQRIRAPL